MRHAAAVLLFLLASLLCAQVSDIPAAQAFAEEGLALIEAERYGDALQKFLLARDLDGENERIEGYITSLNRLITLENYQSDSESIDRFIEEREKTRDEKKEESEPVEGEVDFITQEQNKEKARLDRVVGLITLRFPFLNSSNGDPRVDNDLRQTGEVFQGFSYSLSYFPDIFNRTMGVEGGYGSFSMEVNDELNLYDEAYCGFVLRNYFNEQPGSYSLIGTHFNVGFFFQENVDAEERRLLNFFRSEVFLHDPLFYRFFKSPVLKNISVDGTFQITFFDETYLLAYGGGGTVKLGSRLDLTAKFLYRNLMVDNTPYPSWTTFMGIDYSFR